MSPVGITIRLRVIYDKQRNRLWAIMHVEGPSPQEVTSPQDHQDRITPLIFAASDPLGLKPTWFGIETLEFQPVGDFDLVTPALAKQLNTNLAAQLAWAGFSVNLRDNPSLSVHPLVRPGTLRVSGRTGLNIQKPVMTLKRRRPAYFGPVVSSCAGSDGGFNHTPT